MDINITALDGAVTIALAGKLNTVTSQELYKSLMPALADARRLILDFEKLAH